MGSERNTCSKLQVNVLSVANGTESLTDPMNWIVMEIAITVICFVQNVQYPISNTWKR